MILEAKDIVAGYGNIEILHGVSIGVEESKIACVLGPNGAGKSTLLKAIFGIIRPGGGNVFFEGEEITSLAPHKLLPKGMSFVLQRRSIFPYMTVLDNLKMGAYTMKGKQDLEKRLQDAYTIFPVLEKKRKHLAASMSGGEQRMLELARAMMLKPRLLLLDEPSSGLAPIITKGIFQKIKEMNQQGITFLIVEQNVRLALRMCDYGYVLELGRNRLEGKCSELINDESLAKIYMGSFKKAEVPS